MTLTIEHPSDDTTVSVAGEELRRAAWTEPVPVLAGQSEIVVKTASHAPVKQTVTLAAGDKTSVTLDAQSGEPDAPAAPAPVAVTPPSHPVPMRTWAYVAGGVGVAGLAVFAISGAMAKSTYDDLNNACHSGPCGPDKSGRDRLGQDRKRPSPTWGWASGLAGVAAGATPLRAVAARGARRSGPSTAPGTGVGARAGLVWSEGPLVRTSVTVMLALLTPACGLDFDRYDSSDAAFDAAADGPGSAETSTANDSAAAMEASVGDDASTMDEPPECGASCLSSATTCGTMCQTTFANCMGGKQSCKNQEMNCYAQCQFMCMQCALGASCQGVTNQCMTASHP